MARNEDADPIPGLIRIAKRAEEMEDFQLAVSCYKELAAHCYPKLKAIEHSGRTETALTVRWLDAQET